MDTVTQQPAECSCSCGRGRADSLTMFLAAYAPPGAVLDARGPIFENDAFAALRRRHSDLLAALTGGRRQATTVLDGRAVSWTITIQADQPRRTIILAQDDGADDEDDAGMKMRPSKRSRTDSQGSFVPLLSPPSSSSSSCFNAPVQTPPSLQPSSLPLSSLFSSSTPTQAVPSPTAPAHSWIHDPRFRALATALGTAGELLRTHDWSATALGPVHTWSVELVTLFGTILHSQSGACLVWGPAHVLLYNSAYIALLGRDKHPAAFGARVRDVWAEVLPEVGPLIARTLAGEGFLLDDRQLLMARPVLGGGDVEEVHITFSCVPIYGAEGEVQGVYAPVVETSPKIRSERRMAALCRLATRLTTARTLADTLSGTCEVLSGLEEDFPYAAAYIVAGGCPACSVRRLPH
jgi:PAS domain-containing protein